MFCTKYILAPEKTISEGEGLGEFHECNDLSVLIDYMSRKTDDGEYFIEVLDIIGVNGSEYTR